MSDSSIVIGYIEEPHPWCQPGDMTFFHRANDAVIAALPADDPFPPICRALFATTGADGLHGSMKGTRLIHFAGHFNAFGEDVEEWLDKFEALLDRLYWTEAEVFLVRGYTRPHLRLAYTVTREAAESYWGQSPAPPKAWMLEGFDLRSDPPEPDGFVAGLVEDRIARRRDT